MRCIIDGECCNGNPCPNKCEYYFSLCLREASTPVSMRFDNGEGGPGCLALETAAGRGIDNTATFTDSVFGTDNPITLNGTEWVSDYC